MIRFYIDSILFEYQIDSFEFSGGERQVRLPCLTMPEKIEKKLIIHANIRNSQLLLDLLLTVDALRRKYGNLNRVEKVLYLPYLPYSRQDRVCAEGEALSLAVFAGLINSLDFDRVVTLDCHSEVSTALINNLVNISQAEMIGMYLHPSSTAVYVSPDVGAAKKIYALPKRPVIVATKNRDPSTGAITETTVNADSLDPDRQYLIVDDICDGGRTFIELAKVLKAKGAREILLWVTHGIFSKGPAVFNDLLDEIHCTDSFPVKKYTPIVKSLLVCHCVVEDKIKQEFNEV